MLERERSRELDGGFGVRHHVLGERPVVVKASHFPGVAEPRIQAAILTLGQATARAGCARLFEVQHAHSISHLPPTCAFSANGCDGPSGLVRGNHGQFGVELAMQHLEVGVAETGRVDLDEEFRILDMWHIFGAQLIGPVILRSREN